MFSHIGIIAWAREQAALLEACAWSQHPSCPCSKAGHLQPLVGVRFANSRAQHWVLDTALFPGVGVGGVWEGIHYIGLIPSRAGALCSYQDRYLFGCEFAFPALNASARTSICGSTEYTLSSLTQQ